MTEKITRAKAIRLKCLDCCGDAPAEVRSCTITSCPLYPFRMGKADAVANTTEAKRTESIVR